MDFPVPAGTVQVAQDLVAAAVPTDVRRRFQLGSLSLYEQHHLLREEGAIDHGRTLEAPPFSTVIRVGVVDRRQGFLPNLGLSRAQGVTLQLRIFADFVSR